MVVVVVVVVVVLVVVACLCDLVFFVRQREARRRSLHQCISHGRGDELLSRHLVQPCNQDLAGLVAFVNAVFQSAVIIFPAASQLPLQGFGAHSCAVVSSKDKRVLFSLAHRILQMFVPDLAS